MHLIIEMKHVKNMIKTVQKYRKKHQLKKMSQTYMHESWSQTLIKDYLQ